MIHVAPQDGAFDLWHVYAKELGRWFSYDEAGHEQGKRIYTVPFTSTFITVGLDVSEPVRNHDLFRLGDLLLPPNTPVFMPKSSYSARLLEYLQCVSIVSVKPLLLIMLRQMSEHWQEKPRVAGKARPG